MAFTDNCDLFAAVHEDGVNRVINHIRQQRPSWFNFATADIAANPELWCSKIDVTNDVKKYLNPFFTILPPLPLLGADSPPVGIGFEAQLTKALIDFHPSNVIALPAELNPPLQAQHFALEFRICGGLGCASDREIEQIPVGGTSTSVTGTNVPPPPKQIVLRTRPICFCLEVFVTGHFTFQNNLLLGHVDGIDIVDITPEPLEDNLNCYIKMCVNVVLREKLAIPISTYTFNIFNFASITLSPTPNPPVPNNPAIEDDELKVFINLS